MKPPCLLVCVHSRLTPGRPSCGRRGMVLLERLRQEAARRGIEAVVEPLDCFGQCELGPNVRIAPGGRFFHDATPERAGEIVEELLRFTAAKRA